ncbi:MFS transporter [Microbacterium arborescens]
MHPVLPGAPSFGYRALFALGAIVAAARWVLLAFATDWPLFALSQVLHAGSYATTHIAFAMYVRHRVAIEDQPAAQGLYASLAMGSQA